MPTPTWLVPLLEAAVYGVGAGVGAHTAGADLNTALAAGVVAGVGKLAPSRITPVSPPAPPA